MSVQPTAGSSPTRQTALSLTADLAALAFVARFAVLVYALTEPCWDGHYYDLGARRIAGGHGYSEDLFLANPDGTPNVVWHAWAHYPVGYSGFLAAFFKLFGGSLAVAPFANALTGAALVAVVHRVARYVFVAAPESEGADPKSARTGEIRAVVAALLVALHPGLVLYSGALMTEPLAALGFFVAAWLVLADDNPWRGAALAGIVLGATTLVRPNAILLAPFLALGARRLTGASLPRRAITLVARGAIVSVLALVTVMPWTLRNCRVMDRCTLVSTNAGWNLVIGAAPGATGKFEFLVGHTPEGAPTCAEGGQVEQDRCWFGYGAGIIRRDFSRWLSLVPAKLHYTLDAEWFPINYLREARPDLVSAETHIAWGRVLTGGSFGLIALAALASLGHPLGRKGSNAIPLSSYAIQLALLAALSALVVVGLSGTSSPIAWPLGVAACLLPMLSLPGAPPRKSGEWIVAAMIVTTLVTHAIFFGEDRYHLVITPAFALLAAGLGRRMG